MTVKPKTKTIRRLEMNMPGFNAESSLGLTMSIYREKAILGGSGGGEVLPMQEFLGSPTLSQNLVFPPVSNNKMLQICAIARLLEM
jgi:hypothetical protein